EVCHALRLGLRGRRVLARALRRKLLGDEGTALDAAGEVDVPADLEQVGNGPAVHDRDDRALALDVVEREAEAAVCLRIPGDGPAYLPGQRDLAGVAGKVARLQQRHRAAADRRVEQE